MNIEFLSEKIYDLIVVNPHNISYFKFNKNNKILKAETLEVNIVKDGIFLKENFEEALRVLIEKHKLSVLGIVLNLPNILYLKITLPRSASTQETITNYLKVSFPLSLEKYSFFYKEDRYRLNPTISNFNLVFITKEIIDSLLRIIEKQNLIPLFITPSFETIYHYLVNKPLIQFNEDYVILVIEKNLIAVFLIKDLRIEKLLIEEIDLEKSDISLLIFRFYNFLRPNIDPETKILFFSEKEIAPFSEITHKQIIFNIKPPEMILEGANYIFSKVFSDQEFIDFLPLKSHSAYFLNRLPSILFFLGFFLFLVFFIVSGVFLGFIFKFNKEIGNLQENLRKIKMTQTEAESQIKQLLEINKNLPLQSLENFDKIEKARSLDNLEEISWINPDKITFIFKVKTSDLEATKSKISQILPGIKLLREENISENEVKLIYGF